MKQLRHPALTLFAAILLLLSACFKEKRSNKAGEKMQAFVVDIAAYARGLDQDFIVIPQNGAELAFEQLDPEARTNSEYLAAIDGLGIEELFYNGGLGEDGERLPMLQQLVGEKVILVSEFVQDDANIPDAIQRNAAEGFLCFPRSSTNYDYQQIPDSVPQENTNDITTLAEVQNYLYLISTDQFSSKQQYLNALQNTNFDLLLLDLFYEDDAMTTEEVATLKQKAKGGKRLVIAYMNIGAAESYRYYWQPNWKKGRPNWLKKPYEGYDDELWVKFWHPDWQAIIFGQPDSYTKKILDAGFDGVYLDNVEAYYFLYFD